MNALDQDCCLPGVWQFEKGLPETEVEMSEVQDETFCEGHGVVER